MSNSNLFQTNQRVINVEATLYAAHKHDLSGEIDISVYANADYILEFEMTHVKTSFVNELSLRVAGEEVGRFAPAEGFTRFFRHACDGDLGFIPHEGQSVEVYHVDDLVCSGVFTAD